MAIFSGAFRGDIGTAPLGGLSNNLPSSDGLVTGAIISGDEVAREVVGDFARHQPVSFLKRTIGGAYQFSYFDDYYNRVWMIPSIADFGPLTATTSIGVYMWNAHFRTTTLIEVASPPDPSLSLAGITMPLAIRPLQTIPVSVWAMQDGDPTINGTFSFTFSPFEIANLQVTGIRARLWEFPPNWIDPLEVTLEYRSEIITSRSGREQRRGLRQRPRKELAFNALASEADFRAFIRHMSHWQARPFLMPEFYRVARLNESLEEGVSLAEFQTVPDWLEVDKVVAIRHGKKFMIRTVTGISGTSVTFNAGASGHWPKGCRVYPTISGHLSPRIQGRQHSNNAISIDVRFSSDPGLEKWPEVPPSPRNYRQRELWLKKPNWASAPTPEFVSSLDTLDYGIGRIDSFVPWEFNDRYQKAEYVGFTAVQVEEVIQFYRRNFAQVGEFFMPTYTEDLVIKTEAPLGSSNLRIAGTETAADYANGKVYRDLIVFMKSGAWMPRRILNIYRIDDADGSDTIIQIDGPWEIAIRPERVRQICWLPLCRLASDSLTIQWLTDETAQIGMAIKTLENLPPEGW